ncbi:MAG: hypothetical protein ACI88Z_000467 [Sphingobacteriales bacterium]|jgi:hypothetical protein
MKTHLFLFLSLFLFANALAQKSTLSGYIKELGSQETLIGATIYFPEIKQGTVTNNYGFYSFTLPKQDTLIVWISYVGYTTQFLRIPFKKDLTFNGILTNATDLDEVVIEGNQINVAQESQMSAISVPAKMIKELPAILGEKDVIKTIQLLPGIQSGSEGQAGLYVRGGGPDQNLIILDDAVVYNANHLFGFFSTFNGDAIKNVNVVKGGFPARYGGRLSSVVDLTMKDGNMEKPSGEVGVGLISSRLTLEGPVKKGKSSFLISGRRTYIDALLQPAIRIAQPGSAIGYYFYDLNMKFNHKIDEKNRLFISSYLGRDKFYFKLEDDDVKDAANLSWGNVTTTARWNHQITNKLFANTSLIFSNFDLNVSNTVVEKRKEEEYSLSYSSGIRDYTTKFDLDYLPSPRHSIKMGALLTHHTFTPNAFTVKNPDPKNNISNISKTPSVETAVYAEDDFRLGNRLKLNGGLRFVSFMPKGEQYFSLEPRLGARYMITDDLSAKASYAKMNQYLHLLTSANPGLPSDLWIPATSRIKPQQSSQIAAGLAKTFPNKNLEITLEGYYKEMKNIISFKEGASFLIDDPFEPEVENLDWQDKVTSGNGKSYGAEVFTQYSEGDFTGWAGYTLSWTIHQFEEINNGQPYYPKYDRRHDISLVGNYKLNERWTVSSSWVYGTGNTLTLESGYFKSFSENNGHQNNVDYNGKNNFRGEAYHRLDLSFRSTKKKKRGTQTWEYGLYNAYSRANPFYYTYISSDLGFGDAVPKLHRISLFPIIPSVSYSYKF